MSTAPETAVTTETTVLPIKAIAIKKEEILRSGALPKLNDLEASIKTDGILIPLLVTPSPEAGVYLLVAGHRRLMAARSLGLAEVPVRVVNADGEKHLRKALVENLQRADMSPWDKAVALNRLVEQTKLSQTDVAKTIGVTAAFVSQHLALLGLPPAVVANLKQEKISFSHARELCRLPPNLAEKFSEDAMAYTTDELKVKVDSALAKEEAKDVAEKKKKKSKTDEAVHKTAADYYREVEFTPVKKDDLRELLIQYGAKREKAGDEKKRQEYTQILKGLTLAADLRLR